MPRQTLTAAEAARALGISVDTLRRWDRAGKLRVERDSANRRFVAVAGQEAIIADSTDEAWEWVRKNHADDLGPHVQFVFAEKGFRIYAITW